MLENNPLRQYFRRPSIYFKLPSGGRGYPPGIVNVPENGELPVYPMTAIDEMTVRTPDGLFNGDAINLLIKSCIPAVLEPLKLLTLDVDACIIAIKAAADDGKMEITTTCPACSEDTKFDINLMPLLNEISPLDYTEILKVGDLGVKFKSLMYADTNEMNLLQFQIQKTLYTIDQITEDSDQKQQIMTDAIKQMNELVLRMVSKSIEYIQTPETRVTDLAFIQDFLSNCERSVNTLIKDTSVRLREKNEIKPLDVTCPQCKHQYKQKVVLNATDFFD
jgi:hypothetical protein